MKKLLYLIALTVLLNSCEKDNTSNNNGENTISGDWKTVAP